MVKLHLGCGKRNFGAEWIHIDQCKYPHVVAYDVVELPVNPGTVDLIYASHLLEHFDKAEALTVVLPAWYKALKKGGMLRVAVPNFAAMARLYVEGKFPLNNFLGPLYGRHCYEIFQSGVSQWQYHKTVYDRESLRELLYSVGFSGAATYDWRETEHAGFDDCSQAYLPHMNKHDGTLISLNMEAVK
jgi:predicted SAM-dependent methyltransferase